MFTRSSILKEMKDIPASRLEELYEFVHALSHTAGQNEALRRKILSFAGSFEGMSKKDFTSFITHTRKTRKNLFDRKVKL